MVVTEEAVREIRRKMERDIHIEYCRLVAEAKEKKRRHLNAASSHEHSAAQSEAEVVAAQQGVVEFREGARCLADDGQGVSGSGKKPRSFLITKEVQGAVGNALAVLKLLLASSGGAERVFEYRPGTRAPAHGASDVFLGRLEGDQVVAVDGVLAGCRFPSLCLWARACKEELTGQPVKGVSVKPYIFVGDISLLMHEKNLVAGRRPPASQALCDDAGAKEGGGRAKDVAQAAGQRGRGKELDAEGLEEDLIFSHVSSFLQEERQQHMKKRARKTCEKRELQSVSAPSPPHTHIKEEEASSSSSKQEKSRRCVILDCSIAGLSAERHMDVLRATPTVNTRTLKNVLAGRFISPVSDSKEQLLRQYITALHGPTNLEQVTSVVSKDKSASSSSVAPLASGSQMKRSALMQDTPAKTAKKRKSACKDEPSSSLLLKTEEAIELDRQPFKVGKAARDLELLPCLAHLELLPIEAASAAGKGKGNEENSTPPLPSTPRLAGLHFRGCVAGCVAEAPWANHGAAERGHTKFVGTSLVAAQEGQSGRGRVWSGPTPAEEFAQARAADASLERDDVGTGACDEVVAALALAHTAPHPAPPPVPPLPRQTDVHHPRPLCLFSSTLATSCSTTSDSRGSPALPSLLFGSPVPRKVAAIGGRWGGSGGGAGGSEEGKIGGPRKCHAIVDGAGCGERVPDRGASGMSMGGVRGMGVRGMDKVKIITASPSRLGRVLGESSGPIGGRESERIGGARVLTSAPEVREL